MFRVQVVNHRVDWYQGAEQRRPANVVIACTSKWLR